MENVILRLFLCCVCLLPLFKVMAYDFIYNNVPYCFNSDGATVYATYKSKSSFVNYNNTIVNIPETVIYKSHRYKVTAVGDSAFHFSTGLKGITLSNNVRTIGRAAFWGCKLLTLNLSDSLEVIGDHAFYNCSQLRTLVIPASVTNIGEQAFAACGKINSITVSLENAVYDSRDNCNAIIETATNKLIRGCSSTVIPSSVITICDYAFDYVEGLKGIEIPGSVKTIGNSAFRNLGLLSFVLFGDSVKSIGDYAFADCPKLKAMCLPKSVKTIGDHVFLNDNGLDLTISADIGFGSMHCSGGTLNVLADVSTVGAIFVAPDSIYSLALVPPVCDENTFMSYDAVLHVPEMAVDAYQNDVIWSRFTVVADELTTVDSLFFRRDSLSMIPLDTLQLDYVISPKSIPYNLYWYSSNPSVVEVDSMGNVIAEKKGAADIFVTCMDKYAKCHIKVDDYAITVAVDVHDLTLPLGYNASLKLSSTPVQREIIVENSDTLVVRAIVSNVHGHYYCSVKALKTGNATLVFSVDGSNVTQDSCRVTVVHPIGDATGDGLVDVEDVNALINVILRFADYPSAEDQEFYDLDNSGIIDVEDVNKLVNIILGL